MKIKAYLSYNEYHNSKGYKMFEVVDDIPKLKDCWSFRNKEYISDVKELNPDCDYQGGEVKHYRFFEVETLDWEEENDYYYVCVEVVDEYEE